MEYTLDIDSKLSYNFFFFNFFICTKYLINTHYKLDIKIFFQLFETQIDGLCIITTILNLVGTFGM